MSVVELITIQEQLNNRKSLPIQGYVDKNGCLICNSHKLRDGDYPAITRKGKKWLMHRYIFTKWCEEIPQGMSVRHKCNNTLCINPDHLELGTHWDNMQDKIRAGNQPKGSKHAGAKLNEEKVYYIRFVATESNKELAEKYGETV